MAGTGGGLRCPTRDVQADPSEIPVRDEVEPHGEYMTPVYDQAQLGSCTSNAAAAAIAASRIVDGVEPFYPARLAIYADRDHGRSGS